MALSEVDEQTENALIRESRRAGRRNVCPGSQSGAGTSRSGMVCRVEQARPNHYACLSCYSSKRKGTPKPGPPGTERPSCENPKTHDCCRRGGARRSDISPSAANAGRRGVSGARERQDAAYDRVPKEPVDRASGKNVIPMCADGRNSNSAKGTHSRALQTTVPRTRRGALRGNMRELQSRSLESVVNRFSVLKAKVTVPCVQGMKRGRGRNRRRLVFFRTGERRGTPKLGPAGTEARSDRVRGAETWPYATG